MLHADLRKRFVPRYIEMLERRTVLSTLVAVLDSGANPTDSSGANLIPYMDYTDAFNEITQQHGQGAVIDNFGHGTTVSSNSVTEIQNAAGYLGITLDVKILPIKIYNINPGTDFTNPDTSYINLINAIYYAESKGAKVINLSLAGGSDPSETVTVNGTLTTKTVSQAMADVAAQGVVISVAAGNSGTNLDAKPVFYYGSEYLHDPNFNPAIPSAIVTTSCDTSGGLQPGVSYGLNHVDVAEPDSQATSYSTGRTSGLAGVIASLEPAWSAQQITDRIRQTVTSTANLANYVIRGGYVNLQAAVTGLYIAPPSPPTNLMAAAHG